MTQSLRIVYAIGHRPSGVVKIGLTNHVGTRLNALQCGSPLLLEVFRTAPGTMALERSIHRLFEDKRLHGEWFQLSPGDVDTELRKVFCLATGVELVEEPVQVEPPQPALIAAPPPVIDLTGPSFAKFGYRWAYRPEEVAEALGVTRDVVFALIRERRLRSAKIGRLIRILSPNCGKLEAAS